MTTSTRETNTLALVLVTLHDRAVRTMMYLIF